VTDLEIGMALPTMAGEIETPGIGGVADAARHVERLGLESVWVPDLVTGDGTPVLEATVALAAAAAATARVGVGFSVLVLPLRPVALTAAQIQTLQHVSGNRVLLGVGSGASSGTPFWQAVGGPTRGRGRRTDAALEVLPQLIAGAPTRLVDQPGQPVVTLAPPAPVPPILVGGGDSDVALRRAATRGDGWFPSLLTPDRLAVGVTKLRELAAERGRPTPNVTVGIHAVLGTDQTARSARDALVRDLMDGPGMSPEQAAMIVVTGSPKQAAERFAAYAAAGADRLVIAPTGRDWMRRCDLVAEANAMLG
jgi:alkanesulfonate monooxygenase SsuD/methylene tetrahydromethanopterin reductase-like flavin-dependent oxidoreductase (luciferase family)